MECARVPAHRIVEPRGHGTSAEASDRRLSSTIMSSSGSYDPIEYWDQLHRDDSVRAVGQHQFSVSVNRWLYRIGRDNLIAFLNRNRVLVPPPATVFEAGAGRGFWVREWYRLGAVRVDGCDLAAAAVARLMADFPSSTFTQGDVAELGVIPSGGDYDLVTALNVLLHVTDEVRFRAACANIAAAVAPGGHLLIADAALAHRRHDAPDPQAASLARPIDSFKEAVEPAGLRLVAVGPSTVIGANPIDGRSRSLLRVMQRTWEAGMRAASHSDALGNVVGRGLAILDRPLMWTGLAPSGKFLLFRRPP